jgi:hypothetical protein
VQLPECQQQLRAYVAPGGEYCQEVSAALGRAPPWRGCCQAWLLPGAARTPPGTLPPWPPGGAGAEAGLLLRPRWRWRRPPPWTPSGASQSWRAVRACQSRGCDPSQRSCRRPTLPPC